MEPETLEDQLRRATRNFTTRLPEDQVLTLGRDLARELARAHAETPPRYPELDPAQVLMEDGRPRLAGTRPAGEVGEDLFRLGALLHWLASGDRPQVSWRLDGPPPVSLSSLPRRAVLQVLAAPRPAHRYASAAEAVQALEEVLQASPQSAPPWPMFRGGPERTGRAEGTVPAGGLTPVWQARVGAVLSSAVVTADLVLAVTADGRLLFLDRAHGRRVHELKVGSAAESSPALAEGVAHVGNDDGELVGVDVARGEERYRLKVGQLVRSSPLPLPNGPVVVGVVEAKGAGALVALDPAKGKPLWARKLGAVFSSPARAGSLVLVGSDDGSLHALSADKGAPAWSQKVGGKVRATPAVAGELAVVGGFEGRVLAVRVADGTVAWTAEVGHALYSSPCLAEGLAVFGCHEGHVHALDLKTGEARFEAPTRGPVISSPVALGAGGRVLAASTDGALYLLDAGGRVLQRTPLAHSVQSSPAVAADLAFLGSSEGVHALRLAP
jgi:outer membrane protein assembly factor BamB